MGVNRRYGAYVVRHKWFVFLAGLRVGPPPGLPVLRHLRWWLQLALHDLSKLRPSEWRPYAVNFYTGPRPGELVRVSIDNGDQGLCRVIQAEPDPSGRPNARDCLVQDSVGRRFLAFAREIHRSEVEAAFDVAWVQHQHRNPHHWQHWVLREDDGATKLLPMPDRYVREMVADWAGAGRAITGKWDPLPWYERTKANRLLEMDVEGTAFYVDALVRDLARRLA